MNAIKSPQQARVIYAAYGAAILFAIHLVTYLIPSIRDVTTSSSLIGAELLALLAVAEHLILFPVVAVLPAPTWARAVGYGWLVLDIATDIMQLNGVDKPTYLALRYGANIAAALWIASVSWQTKGAMRIIGWLVALTLAIYSFIAFFPFTFVILLPSLVLLPVWFVLGGRLMAINNYFDKPTPIPPINLERMQATTRDLATLLGIALPGYSNRKDQPLPAGFTRLQGKQVSGSQPDLE